MAANAHENEVREWIESMTGESLDDDTQEALKSGVVLLNLINTLEPGKVPDKKIYTGRMAFKQMENIVTFNNAARDLGVPDRENFVTVDLFEGSNMRQVFLCLMSLKRASGHGFERADTSAGQVSLADLDLAEDETTSATRAELLKRRQEEAFNKNRDVQRLGGARRAAEIDIGLEETGIVSTCPVCGLPVTSGAITALDDITFHRKCFLCAKCKTELASKPYYEKNGEAYCDRCALIS